MDVAAILVMWPKCGEQTFVPPDHEGSIWNLALISAVVPEEKMSDECGQQKKPAYKLTYSLKVLVS